MVRWFQQLSQLCRLVTTIPRLVVPLPPSLHPTHLRNCRCGCRLDKLGHHRALAGSLGPECSFRFARLHDEGLLRCLCRLVDIPGNLVPQRIKDSCTLSPRCGLGLRSATRTREAAFWVSWADEVHMIHEHHPDVAARVVAGLTHPDDAPNLGAAARAVDNPRGVCGFEPPSWHDLRLGARPPPMPTDDFAFEGWQHEAAAREEEDHRLFQVFPALSITERALLHAQSGAGGGVAFSAIPSSPLTPIDTPLFRVLLLRRLHLPLSPLDP